MKCLPLLVPAHSTSHSKGVVGCSAIWLVGLAAFEGGTTAFGQAQAVAEELFRGSCINGC